MSWVWSSKGTWILISLETGFPFSCGSYSLEVVCIKKGAPECTELTASLVSSSLGCRGWHCPGLVEHPMPLSRQESSGTGNGIGALGRCEIQRKVDALFFFHLYGLGMVLVEPRKLRFQDSCSIPGGRQVPEAKFFLWNVTPSPSLSLAKLSHY